VLSSHALVAAGGGRPLLSRHVPACYWLLRTHAMGDRAPRARRRTARAPLGEPGGRSRPTMVDEGARTAFGKRVFETDELVRVRVLSKRRSSSSSGGSSALKCQLRARRSPLRLIVSRRRPVVTSRCPDKCESATVAAVVASTKLYKDTRPRRRRRPPFDASKRAGSVADAASRPRGPSRQVLDQLDPRRPVEENFARWDRCMYDPLSRSRATVLRVGPNRPD
jgi:hypothetical protein